MTSGVGRARTGRRRSCPENGLPWDVAHRRPTLLSQRSWRPARAGPRWRPAGNDGLSVPLSARSRRTSAGYPGRRVSGDPPRGVGLGRDPSTRRFFLCERRWPTGLQTRQSAAWLASLRLADEIGARHRALMERWRETPPARDVRGICCAPGVALQLEYRYGVRTAESLSRRRVASLVEGSETNDSAAGASGQKVRRTPRCARHR